MKQTILILALGFIISCSSGKDKVVSVPVKDTLEVGNRWESADAFAFDTLYDGNGNIRIDGIWYTQKEALLKYKLDEIASLLHTRKETSQLNGTGEKIKFDTGDFPTSKWIEDNAIFYNRDSNDRWIAVEYQSDELVIWHKGKRILKIDKATGDLYYIPVIFCPHSQYTTFKKLK